MSPTCDKFYLQSLDESERKWKSLGCVILFATHGLYSPGNSPGQNTGVGSLSLPNPGIKPRSPALQADSLAAEPQGKPKNIGVGTLSFLQGIVPTLGTNPGLMHCRAIRYQLNHKGSPWKENLDDIWKQRKKVKTACITMWDSPCEYYDRQTY